MSTLTENKSIVLLKEKIIIFCFLLTIKSHLCLRKVAFVIKNRE